LFVNYTHSLHSGRSHKFLHFNQFSLTPSTLITVSM